MRPAIRALPLIAAAFVLGTVVGGMPTTTLATFSATTTSPGNDFTNLVVQPAVQSGPATQAGGYVQLSWSASPTASSQSVTYAVLRSPSGAGVWTQVTTLGGLTYTDLPPSDGSWDYEIGSVVVTFKTDSNIQTGLSDRTPPTAATSLTARTGSSSGQVNLTWTAAADGGSGVAGYTIRYVQASKCPTASPANYPGSTTVGAVTAATVGGLMSSKAYCFYLTTTDNAGNVSGPSSVASANAK